MSEHVFFLNSWDFTRTYGDMMGEKTMYILYNSEQQHMCFFSMITGSSEIWQTMVELCGTGR